MTEQSVCTGCGGPLPEADPLGLITCPKCGRVTKMGGGPVAGPPDPPAPRPSDGGPQLSGWPAPPVAAPPVGSWAPPAAVAGAPQTATGGPGGIPDDLIHDVSGATKTVKRIGCAVIPIAVFLIVAGSVVGALRSCDVEAFKQSVDPGYDKYSSYITLGGSTTVLETDGPDTEVVAVIQQSSNGQLERRLARIAFTGEGSELLWESEPLDDDAYRAEIALVDDTLFAGIEDKLLALDASTGTTRWRTTLHDQVTAGCPDCFAAVGDNLVVRTTDAYVTGYTPASAETQWSKRLNSTSGSISVAGNRLFVVDDPEDPSQLTPVALVDAATGKTIRSTTPTCADNPDSPWDLEVSAGGAIREVPGGRDVVAVFGFGDACVTRWNPETGTFRWNSRLNGLSSFDQDDVLVGESDLVLSNTSGQMVTVYLPNGKPRLLEAPGDVRVTPSEIVGRTLVADTVTTRGTARGGLMGFDLATGKRMWAQSSLGTAQPVSKGPYSSSDALFDGTPRYVLVPVDDGINVFTFEGTDRTFTAAPLDLATGELGTEVRRAFLTRYDSGTPSISVDGVDSGRLVVTIDSLLQAIPDSGTGEVVSFPDQD